MKITEKEIIWMLPQGMLRKFRIVLTVFSLYGRLLLIDNLLPVLTLQVAFISFTEKDRNRKGAHCIRIQIRSYFNSRCSSTIPYSPAFITTNLLTMVYCPYVCICEMFPFCLYFLNSVSPRTALSYWSLRMLYM